MNIGDLNKREKNKLQTHTVLVATARKMFREYGFAETKIEEIAAAADVAVGTCYNYFDRKTDLLIAIVLDADRAAISEAEHILANLPDDPAVALQAIAVHDSRYSLFALNKVCWRHLLASTIQNPGSPSSRAYLETTSDLRNLMVRCVSQLKKLGKIRSDIDVAAAANTVFLTKYRLFINHVSDDAAPFSQHEKEVCAAISLMIDGIRIRCSA
jgi:AcrR family transcriptional regulator